jgi:ATP-dependent RNA helicase RhlE
MRFTDLQLSPPLQEALHGLGFEEATPIQTQAIPPGLARRDVVGCAQTGTGKTLAFLLPALELMLRDGNRSRNPRVVVVEPTRELAMQVAADAKAAATGTPFAVVAVYGGAGMQKQIDALRHGADIVVATPGRLMDHMRRGNVRLGELELLVLDEADRMLDMGFLPDIKHIVGRTPEGRQTMLFSATMPATILALARQFLRDPVKIELEPARPPETLDQALYPVPKHLKLQLLLAILRQKDVSSMLVFTRTKRNADMVSRQLRESGVSVGCIHGDFSQRERVAALERFRSGKRQLLVATNVAARGLHVEGISHVVNYDVPEHPEDYVHRIGRTARAEAHGEAITLVTPEDEPLIHRIEYLLDEKIERKRLKGFDYDVPTPSWARPSAKTLARRAAQSQSVADRWRSMGF